MPKKKTLNDMHELAHERGGKCLSTEYVNNSTKLLWECGNGHQWEAMPYTVKAGTWCPECANEYRRSSISEIHELAQERGGKCLSTEYEDSHVKLLWECGSGHQWEAKPYSVKAGTWCPHCAKKKKRR